MYKLGSDSPVAASAAGIPVIIVRLGVGGHRPPFAPSPISPFVTMGEYYQLIDIDKEETQGHWGKLAEFLFWNPGAAVHWLLHPLVLPPMPHIVSHERAQEANNGSNAVG
jgi:hypothetical protein